MPSRLARLSRDAVGQLRPHERRIVAWLTALLAIVTVDVFVQGPLVALDRRVVRWDGERAIPALRPYAWPYDHAGQRAVTVPILFGLAAVLARRHRTWRPIVLAGLTVLALNVVVGGMKIVIGRAQTETGNPSVLTGGMIFPSGHASNMVLTCCMVIYLLRRYGVRVPRSLAVAATVLLTSLTSAVSLYIGSHWVSDLVAGVLVGCLIVYGLIALDRLTSASSPPASALRSASASPEAAAPP